MRTITLNTKTLILAGIAALMLMAVTAVVTLTLSVGMAKAAPAPVDGNMTGNFKEDLRVCGQLFKPGTDEIAICMGAVTWSYHKDIVLGTTSP